jgi:hypothetical protein
MEGARLGYSGKGMAEQRSEGEKGRCPDLYFGDGIEPGLSGTGCDFQPRFAKKEKGRGLFSSCLQEEPLVLCPSGGQTQSLVPSQEVEGGQKKRNRGCRHGLGTYLWLRASWC